MIFCFRNFAYEDLHSAGEESVVEHNRRFSYSPVDTVGAFPARAKAQAQRVILAVKKHLSLGKEATPPARAPEESPAFHFE